VLKTVYRSSCRDKHNCQRRDSNLDPLTPQSDALTTRPLRPARLGGTQGHRQCHHSIERLRLFYSTFIETMRLSCTVFEIAGYMSKVADFDPSHLHLAPPLGVTPVEFRGDLWHQKTRFPELSCGVVCVILRLAILVELRLVTDRQTQTD